MGSVRFLGALSEPLSDAANGSNLCYANNQRKPGDNSSTNWPTDPGTSSKQCDQQTDACK
jgi:hypothetical protein